LNILNNWCDRSNLLITSPVYCSSQPGATGYQFWIYDAHGSYNRRVTRPVSNLAPVNLNTNPIPTNTWLNIRVKPVFNGVPSEFGPACRVRFLPNSAGREMLYDDGSVVTLNLFPNPNRDGLVTMSLEGLDVTDETPAVIEIFDLLGSRVIAERTMAAEGTLNHRLELTDRIGAGLYMVNVTINDQRYTQRLVIQ
ncbi:MAG: T9SS type A sorting domain-containing protein, partial [Flavobacteriales bacterium]|nr:T9SS type A sorting domain-containing protein [Flavobacteriales bacterium]